MSCRVKSRHLAWILAAGTVACATAPRLPPQKIPAIPVESMNPQKSAWLHAHCRTLGVRTYSANTNAIRVSAYQEGANYVEVMYNRAFIDGVWDVVLFSCPTG